MSTERFPVQSFSNISHRQREFSLKFEKKKPLSNPKFTLEKKLNLYCFARALVNYNGGKNQLSFKEGDIIQVTNFKKSKGRIAGEKNVSYFHKEMVQFLPSLELLYSIQWYVFYPKKNLLEPISDTMNVLIEKNFLKYCTLGIPKTFVTEDYEIDLKNMKITGKFSTTSEKETYQLSREKQEATNLNRFTLSEMKTIFKNVLYFLDNTVVSELYSEISVSDQIKSFVEHFKNFYHEIEDRIVRIEEVEKRLLNDRNFESTESFNTISSSRFFLSGIYFILFFFFNFNFNLLF